MTPGVLSPGRTSGAWILASVAAVVLLAFAFRSAQLGDTEPRIDHAHFSAWVQDVRAASHVWPSPEPGQSWRRALEEDEGGLLHEVTRRIHNQPYRVFNLSGLAVYTALAPIFGDSFAGLVQVSIATSVAAVVCLALLPWVLAWRDPTRASLHRIAVPLSAALAACSFYLHWFSAQGWHNPAIAWTLAHAVVVLGLYGPAGPPALSPAGRRIALACFAFTFVMAVHAYFILPWLLVPATLAQLVATRGLPAVRTTGLRLVGFYALATAPAAVVLLMVRSQIGGNLRQSELAAQGALDRGLEWFAHGAQILSWPGLIGALVGLVLLARWRIVLPLVFVVGELLLSVASVRVGAKTWHRTFAYVVPWLILGLVYFVVPCVTSALAALRSRGGGTSSAMPRWGVLALGGLAGLCAAVHLAHQVPPLTASAELCRLVPSYCSFYLTGGRLRETVAEIDSRLPEGALLCPGTYPVSDLYRVLSPRRDVRVLPPLLTLEERLQGGGLASYASRRRLPEDVDALLLLIDADLPEVQESAAEVFGSGGLDWTGGSGRWRGLGTWETETRDYGHLRLYEVMLPGP